MKSKMEAEAHRALNTIVDVLVRFDDDSREGVLATIVLWYAGHHEDRVAAITSLFDRAAELEADIAKGEMQ